MQFNKYVIHWNESLLFSTHINNSPVQLWWFNMHNANSRRTSDEYDGMNEFPKTKWNYTLQPASLPPQPHVYRPMLGHRTGHVTENPKMRNHDHAFSRNVFAVSVYARVIYRRIAQNQMKGQKTKWRFIIDAISVTASTTAPPGYKPTGNLITRKMVIYWKGQNCGLACAWREREKKRSSTSWAITKGRKGHTSMLNCIGFELRLRLQWRKMIDFARRR